MTSDQKLKIKMQNTILVEKQQKYLPYHQAKLINMNILQANKYHLQVK